MVDLSPTGTFTTTSELSATLTGTLPAGTTQINDATITLIGSVSGTYTYLGTDYANGESFWH